MGKVPEYQQLCLHIETKNEHLQKLTYQDVLSIRSSRTKQTVLAKKYDVSVATISRIKTRKAYNNYL